MPSFSGVHGTLSRHVANIQEVGFHINSLEEYTRMFGNGVYLYKNDTNGRLYAREWAKNKIIQERLDGEYECVLFIDFDYADNEHITWSDEEEIKFNKWLKKEIKNITPDGKLTRKIQNRYRMKFISASAVRMLIQYRIIFANMPFPKHLSERGKKRYGACAVKDSSILPRPPYVQG